MSQRGLLAALILSLTTVALTPMGLSAQDDTPVEIILQLRVQRGPSDIVFAYAVDSLMLIPTLRLLEMAEIGVGDVVDSEAVSGVLETTGERFSISTLNHRVAGSGYSDTLRTNEFIWADGELYVEASKLARTLGATTDISWSDLTVIITAAAHFPVIERVRRESRRRLIADETGSNRKRLPGAELRAIDGGVLDWGFDASTRDPVDNFGAQLGLGANLFGGSLNLQLDHRQAGDFSNTLIDYSWLRAWPDNRWMRQVAVGEISTTGVAPRGIRGALVTNRPFLRSSDFGVERLTGTLTPGWEVELYRAGQLIDYERVGQDGQYAFPVRVRYGPNPLEVVAFGPRGQRVSMRRTFEVPFDRLPEGETEYALSGGACQSTGCEAAFNLDIRHGMTDWLTVGVGHEVFARDSLPDLWQPYLKMSAAVSRSLSIGFEGVFRGYATGRLLLAPSQDFRGTLSHSRFSRGVESPLVGSNSVRHTTAGSLFWRPIGADEGIFLQLTGDRSVGQSTTTSNAAAIATLSRGGIRASTSVTYARFESSSGSLFEDTRLNGAAGTTLSLPGSILDGLFVSGRASYDTEGELVEAGAGIGRTVLARWRVDVDAGWRRSGGAVLSLTIGSQLPYMRFLSRNSHTDLGGVQGSQSIEGSVLWNQVAQTAEFGNGRAQGRGGVGGVVFLDSDGDGSRDADEITVEGVTIRIGARAVRSDSAGRYSVWDLVPFEPAPLDIDTLSILNPLWVPATGPALVAPGPNGYRRVDIPLIEAGEVSGTVLVSGDDRALKGVRVILRRAGSEDIVARTFTDGSYYMLGVLPGTYTVLIDPRDADRARVAQQSDTVQVDAGTATRADLQVTPLRQQ